MSANPASDAPLATPVAPLEPHWIDYNGHLNMAYYLVIFDRDADIAFATVGLGPAYAAGGSGTTFSVEAHLRYLREVKAGTPLICDFQLLGYDEKRIHSFQTLRHATEGWAAATCETMTLHVDPRGPKAAPFPATIQAALAQMALAHGALPVPEGAGRAIALKRRDGGA